MGRGILTLSLNDELLQCKLRLYNVEKLNRYTKIGIYHQNEVYSANLIERNGCYESSLVGEFDMEKDFYSALIKTDNNNEPLLAGGTYAGYYFNDTSVFDEKDEEQIEPDTLSLETNICAEEDCDKCEKCKYKEYFYSHTQNDEIKEDHIEEKENEKDKPSLIEALLPQFSYIFENYSADEELNKLINNGKFVSVNETNEHYSIGAIYEGDDMKYICYTVKSNYNQKAPDELGKYYQWLPLDSEDPLSDGYYIVYQDAKDLKILEI